MGDVVELGARSTKDNFTGIPNSILEALYEADLSGRQFRVLLVVARKTYGFHIAADWITSTLLANLMGNSNPGNIRTVVNDLKERKILIVDGRKLSINEDVSSWVKERNALKTKQKRFENEALQKQSEGALKTKRKQFKNEAENASKMKHTKEKRNLLKETITKESDECSASGETVLVVHGEVCVEEERKADPVDEIFEYWQNKMNHPKARLDPKRKRVIQRALKSGYSLDDLKQAVDGCAKTPFNMGQNDRAQVYDGIELILRDGDHIDRFMSNAVQPDVYKAGRRSFAEEMSDTSWANRNWLGDDW